MKIAAMVLASGLSRRFGQDDKLLADLKGQALLAYSLDAVRSADFENRFIICPEPDPRAILARNFGFNVIANSEPEAGQGASISLGAKYLRANGFDAVCILLGDMPFVTPEYLKQIQAMSGDIVFSRTNNKEQPPAIFRGDALEILTTLSGDQGASQLDLSPFTVSNIDLPGEMEKDFDRPEDFNLNIRQ